MTGIYQIRNIENGKRYIGQSTNLSHRKSCHKYDLKNCRHKSELLQEEYNNNPNAFVFEILCECAEDDLDALEIYYISKYNTTDKEYGYNISMGAHLVADTTRIKCSACKMGNKYMQGKKLSEEWKENIRNAQPHKKKIICIENQQVYNSFAEAARLTELNRTKIVSVCTGKRKSTGGLHFKYADEGTSC